MVRVGNWTLTTIETGDFKLDGGAMFGVVPKVLWNRDHPADEDNRINMAMRSLMVQGEVDGEERIILIDVGAGDKLGDKLRSIYQVDYSQNDLLGSLASAGVTPAQVTDVILTHLHFDHCGGSTIIQDHSVVPTFPNAVYHVQQSQWEWAQAQNERDVASYLPENYMPIEQSGQLNLIEGEVELLSDIYLVVVDGHTPGQHLPLIRTVNRTVFYCADLFPTPQHIPMPYIMGYDLEPLKTLDDKKRLLPRAVEEEWIMLYEHDPGKECSFVEHTGKDYRATEQIILEDCL
ncbi:MBL fold metallo-hydrolase [Candidatus Zixiibacteriota bacterium]